MNTELILTSDMLDILFYKKNKLYGAYTLRKFYPNRIKKALLIMIGFVTLLSATTLIPGKTVFRTPTVETVFASIKPLEFKKSELQKKILKPNTKQGARQKFLQNIIIIPKVDSTDQLNDISNLRIGNSTYIHSKGETVNEEFNNNDGQKGDISSAKEVAKQFPFDNPDIQASFPGGNKALIRFLEQNLQVPQTVEFKETIQVKVKFVVDFDGNLQSFTVVKDGGEPFNTEVIRVLKKMPKWIPGKKGEQNVPVFFTIPVKFTADE